MSFKSFDIILITKNQNKPEKAKKFGEKISSDLNLKYRGIERYHKFENSYRILLSGNFPQHENIYEYGLKITSLITSDWKVNYSLDSGEFELIFDKSDYSRFSKQEYNVIDWAQFIIS